MVDWYYIFPILWLGVHPSPQPIYNVVDYVELLIRRKNKSSSSTTSPSMEKRVTILRRVSNISRSPLFPNLL